MLTVKDKIVQQAIRLLFEPSCEKMFLPCSYGYRPGKGAVAAINKVRSLCLCITGCCFAALSG